MSDDTGDLSVPGFEPHPRDGADRAAGVIHGILEDLGSRWALPPEDFGRVLAAEMVRALQEEPVLLNRLAAEVSRNLFRCLRGAKFLDELKIAGVGVRLDRGVLKVKGRMSEDTRREIAERREELVAALQDAS